MSFTCYQCNDPQSLEITVSIQLYKGRCANEITLQLVECQYCEFVGIAVYEEGRLGASDTRTWKHTGYRLDPKDLVIIKEMILDCPDRLNPACECPVHLRLCACDGSGDWIGLKGFNLYDKFPMRMSV